MTPWPTTKVAKAVIEERARQDARFGEQNHPDVVASAYNSYREGYGEEADGWKNNNEFRAAHNKLAWDGILLEEVYEALAESDPTNLRAELIQVAAVAVAWIEAIDRRTATTEGVDPPAPVVRYYEATCRLFYRQRAGVDLELWDEDSRWVYSTYSTIEEQQRECGANDSWPITPDALPQAARPA